jgi:hypothetical protein
MLWQPAPSVTPMCESGTITAIATSSVAIAAQAAIAATFATTASSAAAGAATPAPNDSAMH